MILLVPLAYAIPECQRTTNVGDIPCNIISSWKPSTCSDYTLQVYNLSGVMVQNLTWGDYIPVCNATFNISDVGTYYYNSTVESGIITVEGDAELITAIVILIPLIMAIVFMIASFSQSDQHSILRIFMFLMSLIMFFVAFHMGMLGVVKFMDFPELQELIGSTTYWYAILFGGVIMYFIIYMLYIFFNTMAQKKKERIEY